MTPDEEIFNDGIEQAQRMRHGDQLDYWDGYLTGLMRGFFGSYAVSDELHAALSDPVKASEKASGYRDGYHRLAGCHRAANSIGSAMRRLPDS